MGATKVVFENPIIPGFAPDPSVINVDGTFFLVTSSFWAFPGLPIYSSTDLRSWKHIGNAINRTSQLDLSYASSSMRDDKEQGLWMGTTGLFAPTIRYRNGTFYIVCTNASVNTSMKAENFIITTNDIFSCQWSDPVYFEFYGIDPSLFFDDDGRTYIQGAWMSSFAEQPKTLIKQVEINLHTGELCSETKLIWSGWDSRDTEGPHIYKKDGYYYLVAAEGGTFEYHMLSAARSKDIWGPFESYEQNPIVTAAGTKEYIQNLGHGELFQDDSGDWWYVGLGVRNHNGRYTLGRETFLAPATWPTMGWPKIEQPKVRFERHYNDQSMLERKPTPKLNEPLRVDEVYLRGCDIENYSFSPINGGTTLVASGRDFDSQTGSMTLLAKRQRQLSCETTTSLQLKNQHSRGLSLKAGLALYKDPFRHAEILLDYSTYEVCLNITSKPAEVSVDVRQQLKLLPTDSEIHFKIQATEESYKFYFSRDNITAQGGSRSWTLLGEMDTLAMTQRDFVGPVFAIFAIGEDSGIGSSVDFKNFRVKPGDVEN